MKCVILSGGLGTRISEETSIKPKPLITIGNRPIIWHIMKLYYHYRINDFIICCGYKGELIKSYFNDYFLNNSDFTIDFKNQKKIFHNKSFENWKITLVDTGLETMTGGRLKRVQNFLKNEKNFLLTYGDGLANVNIKKLIDFHLSHKKIATLTGIELKSRFGVLSVAENNRAISFLEKPKYNNSLVNGGYFVFSNKIFKYLKNDSTVLEKKPLETLSKEKNLYVFKHEGFWHSMDTLRDKNLLEGIWKSKNIPWKIWK